MVCWHRPDELFFLLQEEFDSMSFFELTILAVKGNCKKEGVVPLTVTENGYRCIGFIPESVKKCWFFDEGRLIRGIKEILRHQKKVMFQQLGR